MLKVGLTGGIGCGKSTGVNAFRVLGIPIVDADKIAREVVGAKKPALDEIEKAFGSEILLKSGELNRRLLKQKILADPKVLGQLEQILHPVIRREILDQISHHQRSSDQAYVVVDIPLLVEKKYQNMFDRIVVVDCLPEQQYERVINRDGMSEQEIHKIIEIQSTRKNRLKYASDILDNSGTIDYLQAQVEALHFQILGQ